MPATTRESIGELFVDFVATGAETVIQTMESLASKGAAVGGALAGLAGTVAGFGLSGLTASADFQPFANLMERLSRIIGGAFAPVLDVVTDALDAMLGPIQEVAHWFGDVLGVGIEFAMSELRALWSLLQPVAEGFGHIIDVFKPLGEQLNRSFSAVFDVFDKIRVLVGGTLGSVFKELADTIAAVIKPALDLVAEVLRLINDHLEAMGIKTDRFKKAAGYRELSQKGGGMEGALDIYKRVQAAGLKTGGGSKGDFLQQIADNTKRGADNPLWLQPLREFADSIISAIKRFNPFAA